MHKLPSAASIALFYEPIPSTASDLLVAIIAKQGIRTASHSSPLLSLSLSHSTEQPTQILPRVILMSISLADTDYIFILCYDCDSSAGLPDTGTNQPS